MYIPRKALVKASKNNKYIPIVSFKSERLKRILTHTLLFKYFLLSHLKQILIQKNLVSIIRISSLSKKSSLIS